MAQPRPQRLRVTTTKEGSNRRMPKAAPTSGDVETLAPPTCDRLWTTKEVSAFLGVPVTTLHQWRHAGSGPAAFRVGRHLRYDPDVVRRWLVDECSTDSERSA